jgi:hypothetical protein
MKRRGLAPSDLMTFCVDIAFRSQRHQSLSITCLDQMREWDRVDNLPTLTKITNFCAWTCAP